ncbi:MAG: class I SAM-dependent methyltransferase [Deltaproteobacteria bacterium]|nr:class I SAM-dependent methyltransferase [Deltaproteobacteria bacterium]
MTADRAVQRVTRCRLCGGADLHPFLDLGAMPIPNGFLEKKDLGAPEPRYPLGVAVCETCWLAQLTHVVPAELMFSNYLYVPSTSTTMLDHFGRLARDLITRYRLGSDDLVLDIGSNDGTLLTFFRRQGLQVLGVDPASNLARLARMQGVNTLDVLFSSALAAEIARNARPRLVVATNVMAHVSDLHDLCEGVRTLLADDGVLVVEFPYLADLLRRNEFDTIYHEHLSYFSLQPLVRLFSQHGMVVFDVEDLPVHGGSLRIHAGRAGRGRTASARVAALLEEEARTLQGRAAYDEFAGRVHTNMARLVELLESLKADGRRVVGYGASAKGNVLLNSCRVDTRLVEYVVDSIPYKQWRFTPGMHLPVYPEQKLDEDRPDYVLLFAWNFLEEIMAKQAAFRARGGRFILAVPDVRVVP